MMLLLCLLASLLSITEADQCGELYYIEQVPSELHCNPYDVNNTWMPSLVCIAVQTTGNDSIAIKWYHNSTNGTSRQLNSTTLHSNGVTIAHVADLTLEPFSESLLGDYYCQATSDSDVIQSNILTVLGPENYTGLQPCPSIITQNCPTIFKNNSHTTDATSTLATSSVVTASLVASPCQTPSTLPVTGWIIAFSITLFINIALVTLIIGSIFLLVFKKHQMESKECKGMPIIYKKKEIKKEQLLTNSALYQPPITNTHTVNDDDDDYIESVDSTSGPIYIRPNVVVDKPQTVTIDGKMYAIANKRTRLATNPYQDLQST